MEENVVLSIHVMSVKVCAAIIFCENNNFIFEDLRGFSNPREDPRHSARLTRIIPRQNEDMGGLGERVKSDSKVIA
jgi:hypothetical protein